MTAFEAGFAAGERQAWQERGSHRRQLQPAEIHTDYERGWWAGYTPRSLSWAMRARPVTSWLERNEEQAA